MVGYTCRFWQPQEARSRLCDKLCRTPQPRKVLWLWNSWNSSKALLPNNYPQAEKKLFSLERNLLKDKAKATMYDEAIMQYKRNGWAHPLSEQEVHADVTPVYYLPHHGVYSLKRKSTPLRIIFELLPTGRSMSHRKSAWGPASLSWRASYLHQRYFKDVLTNLSTKGRHPGPPVPLEKFQWNKAACHIRSPESHLWGQAFTRHSKLCNVEDR